MVLVSRRPYEALCLREAGLTSRQVREWSKILHLGPYPHARDASAIDSYQDSL